MNKPQEGALPYRFTLLTLPPLLIGFPALGRSGMSLAAIHDELRRPERRAGVFHPQNL